MTNLTATPNPTATSPAPTPRKRRLRLVIIAVVVLVVLGIAWQLVGRREAPAQGTPQAVELSGAELSADLTGATVLAVGEATHGTAAFREVWLEVTKKVVGQGFTTIAWEESAGNMARVDAWVQGGEGEVEDALAAFGYRLNRTQETANLLTWLREYNAAQPEAMRVHLFGYDHQRPEAERDVALAWLETIDPGTASQLREELGAVTTDPYYGAPASYRDAAQRLSEAVLTAAEGSQNEGSDAVGRIHAVLAASALARGVNVSADGNTPAQRDAAMADQLFDLVAMRGEQGGEHTLALGHNGHLDRVGDATGVDGATLGEHAVTKWGEEYRVIGTDARRVVLSDAGSEYSFTVSSPVRGLFEGTRLGYLEMAQASASNRTVLDQEMPMPSAGAGFSQLNATIPSQHTVHVTPAKSWDALVFVEETHAVTPWGDVRR